MSKDDNEENLPTLEEMGILARVTIFQNGWRKRKRDNDEKREETEEKSRQD